MALISGLAMCFYIWALTLGPRPAATSGKADRKTK